MEKLGRCSSIHMVSRAIVLTLCITSMATMIVHAADPDPLQDFCVADFSKTASHMNGFACKERGSVTSKDFVFTGLRGPAGTPSSTGTNAYPTLATVKEFPGINTLGLSHARLDFGIGGVIPPHIHPLATETLFVLEGSVYAGFVSYDNVLYAQTLQKGDLIIFPRGSVHFQINAGNTTASTFNSLNAQYPGFLFVANQMFHANIPHAVLKKSFGVGDRVISQLEAGVPSFFDISTL